jgi:thymidylate synthase (FAD)
MRIIPASYTIEAMPPEDVLERLERIGRVCYKSEDRITPDSAKGFVRKILASGHESVIEHASMSVRFIVDRGVSHELVRHRLAAFSQESTRYCNYGKGGQITFIKPFFWEENDSRYFVWKTAARDAEEAYLKLLAAGASPQEARSVLPNSVKTEVVMTCNLREMRHILKLRTSKKAHPQFREVSVPLLAECKARIPVIFDDIEAA